MPAACNTYILSCARPGKKFGPYRPLHKPHHLFLSNNKETEKYSFDSKLTLPNFRCPSISLDD